MWNESPLFELPSELNNLVSTADSLIGTLQDGINVSQLNLNLLNAALVSTVDPIAAAVKSVITNISSSLGAFAGQGGSVLTITSENSNAGYYDEELGMFVLNSGACLQTVLVKLDDLADNNTPVFTDNSFGIVILFLSTNALDFFKRVLNSFANLINLQDLDYLKNIFAVVDEKYISPVRPVIPLWKRYKLHDLIPVLGNFVVGVQRVLGEASGLVSTGMDASNKLSDFLTEKTAALEEISNLIGEVNNLVSTNPIYKFVYVGNSLDDCKTLLGTDIPFNTANKFSLAVVLVGTVTNITPLRSVLNV